MEEGEMGFRGGNKGGEKGGKERRQTG